MVYGTSLLKWSSTASKSFNGKIKKEIKLCVPFSEERCRECVSWKRKTKQITRFGNKTARFPRKRSTKPNPKFYLFRKPKALRFMF
jgi:hypothetical protein